MIEAGQIVVITALVIAIAIALWWFGVAYKYGQSISGTSYARGANIDTGAIGNGQSGKGYVNLQCDNNSEICVQKATAICTGAINENSNTEGGPEPISNGVPGVYGDFDPTSTVDLTGQLSKLANGKQSYSYCFDAKNYTFKGQACPFSKYDNKTGAGQRPQLISTYTCIPKGSTCKSSITPPIRIR